VVVKEIEKGLTFDDVLLVPRRFSLRSRKEVSTETFLHKKDTAEHTDSLFGDGHRYGVGDGNYDGKTWRDRRYT